MRGLSLKKALNTLGYQVVQYHKGYNIRFGFMMKDQQLYYFSYEDLRYDPTLMVRTADPAIKDKKGNYSDYYGGQNTYPGEQLRKLGVFIVEPRLTSCDYNSL